MYKLLTTATLSLSLFLTACSPDPDTAIQAKYISTKAIAQLEEYSSYSCKELIRENNRIARKLEHSYAHLKKPEAEDYGE